MFLPTVVTTGVAISNITTTRPFPAATTALPNILVDGLLETSITTSNPRPWEDTHICGWYADVSSSAVACGSPMVSATDTRNVVTCTLGQDLPGVFYTGRLGSDGVEAGRRDASFDDEATSLDVAASSNKLCCGSSSPLSECASSSWTGSPTISMLRRATTATVVSLLDEPAYIAGKSTTSETTSDEESSGQGTSMEPVPSTHTSVSTSSKGVVTISASSTMGSTSSSSEKFTSSKMPSSTPFQTPSATPSSTSTSSRSSSSSSTNGPSPTEAASDISTAHRESTTTLLGGNPISDLSSTSEAITSLTSTIAETTSSLPPPTQSAPAQNDSPPSTSKLSSPAKIGIGIGASVGCLATLTGIALFLLKRRRDSDKPDKHDTWTHHPMTTFAPATISTTDQHQQHQQEPQQQQEQQNRQPPARPLRPETPTQPQHQPRIFWHRGPRVAAEELLDGGMGGSEVPVDMRGQAGGAAELDGGSVPAAAATARSRSKTPGVNFSVPRLVDHDRLRLAAGERRRGSPYPAEWRPVEGWRGEAVGGERVEDLEGQMGGVSGEEPRSSGRRGEAWRSSASYPAF